MLRLLLFNYLLLLFIFSLSYFAFFSSSLLSYFVYVAISSKDFTLARKKARLETDPFSNQTVLDEEDGEGKKEVEGGNRIRGEDFLQVRSFSSFSSPPPAFYPPPSASTFSQEFNENDGVEWTDARQYLDNRRASESEIEQLFQGPLFLFVALPPPLFLPFTLPFLEVMLLLSFQLHPLSFSYL